MAPDLQDQSGTNMKVVEGFYNISCPGRFVKEKAAISPSPPDASEDDKDKDPILAVAKSILAKSLEHFLANTQIHPGSSVKKLTSKDAFVYLRLVRAEPGISASDRLLVDFCGVWMPFEEWFDKLPAFTKKMNKFAEELVGPEGYENQFKWWSCNGKKFQFSDLPPELRSLIYVQALGPMVQPGWAPLAPPSGEFFRRSGFKLGCGFRRRGQRLPPEEYPQSLDFGPPNLAILRLNKQFHHEALKTGWEETLKYFVCLSDLSVCLLSISEKDPNCDPSNGLHFAFLRYVQLTFTVHDYLIFVGVDTSMLEEDPVPVQIYPTCEANDLGRLPMLKHLKLVFGPIRDPGIVEKESFHVCGRVLQDLMLALTVRYFGDITNPTFSGHVEPDLKEKWTKLWLSQKSGARVHGHIEAATAVLFPPKCDCVEPCALFLAHLDDYYEESASGHI